jgi:hypothetical protein
VDGLTERVKELMVPRLDVERAHVEPLTFAGLQRISVAA